MDRADVTRWLEGYVSAWKSYDREAIGELFSEDVTYFYRPFDEPLRGREEVVESWFDDPDRPGTYEADYAPVAVDGNVAVAAGTSTYTDPEEIYENCFLLEFDGDGRCSKLTEWYVKRPDA